MTFKRNRYDFKMRDIRTLAQLIRFYKNYSYDVSFVEKTRVLLGKPTVHRRYDELYDYYGLVDRGDNLTFKSIDDNQIQMFYYGSLIHTFQKTNDLDPKYKVEYTEKHLFIYSSQGSESWHVLIGCIKHVVLTNSNVTGKSGKWRDGFYRDDLKTVLWDVFENTYYLTYHLTNGTTVSEIFLEDFLAELRLAGVEMVLKKRKSNKRRDDLMLTIDPPERLFTKMENGMIIPSSSIVSVEYGQH